MDLKFNDPVHLSLPMCNPNLFRISQRFLDLLLNSNFLSEIFIKNNLCNVLFVGICRFSPFRLFKYIFEPTGKGVFYDSVLIEL